MIPGRTNACHARGRPAGRLPRPVRRVLRAPAREHGVRRRRRAAGRLRRAGCRASQARRAAADAALERGQQVFLGSACVYCHTIAGTNASGKIGPDLTHLASRRSLARRRRCRTRAGYLAGWILDPQHLKPGNRMPGTDLSGRELQALLDVPGEPAVMATVDVRATRALVGGAGRASSPGSRTVDHKRIGTALPRHGRRLLPRRRARGGRDARAARAAGRAPARPRGVRPALLDARPDDDLPLRHADALRLRQLPRAAHDRRARHGVPAPERVRLLGLPRAPACSCTRACCSARRPTTAGSTTRRSRCSSYSPGTNIDFYALGLLFLGDLDDRRRDQLHRHDLQAARARDVAQPDAALLLGDPRDVVLDRLRDPVAHRRDVPPRARAPLRLPLLRHAPAAATRCSGSTSSGSSATPTSTSSSCPRSGSSRRSCRRSRAGRLVGYDWVALATMATALLGFGVWVHHMFATGLPQVSLTFFAAASTDHRDPERRSRSSPGSRRC